MESTLVQPVKSMMPLLPRAANPPVERATVAASVVNLQPTAHTIALSATTAQMRESFVMLSVASVALVIVNPVRSDAAAADPSRLMVLMV